MAMKTITVLFSVFAIWVVGNVESATAPAPGVDCSSLILNLADCLSYVTSGSTVNKPEGNCCSGLKTVLKSDAECLCEGFKSSAQLGVTLNMTKAIALPSACHVTAPSLSNCGLSLATPPAMSPEAGSPTSATGPNENPPTPAPGSSGSVALTTSVGSLVLALAVAASFFFI